MSVTEPIRLNRRQLILAAGGLAAALGLATSSASASATGTRAASAGAGDKARIGLVFCVGAGAASADRVRLVKEVVTRACPRIDFVVSTVTAVDEAKMVADRDDLDGFLVWSVGSHEDAVRAFAQGERPVVVAYDAVAGR